MSHLLQRTVDALLRDDEVLAALAVADGVYTSRRQAFRAALEAHGITSTGRSGLNTWIPVRDEAAVVAGMLEHGFAVRSGAAFRLRSGPGIRVTTASLSDPIPVADALATVMGDGSSMRTG